MKNKIEKGFIRLQTEKLDAIGVVEIILILVVLVGLVLIFKNQIIGIVNKAFQAVVGGTDQLIN